MAGVSLVQGNDLAGEKVMPELLVISDSMIAKEADNDTETNTQVFHLVLSPGSKPED